MPPKTKFSKEDIVKAAYEIARENGFSAITARSVANHLNSSVAPIYVNFDTIEDLTAAVIQRVFALSQELLANEQGEDLFEKIGKASLAFAREYPVFFRELVLLPNPYMQAYASMESTLLEAMAGDESMQDLSFEERRSLLFKMRAFQLGISAMTANGHLPEWLSEEGADSMLMEVGEDLWRAQTIKRGEDKK